MQNKTGAQNSSGTLTEFQEGNVHFVVFDESLKQINDSNLTDLTGRLLEITDKATTSRLVLDISSTEFFSSSFIEVLLRVWKRLNSKPKAQMGFVGVQPYCLEVFNVTHLDKLWSIFDSQQAASKAFN